MSVYVDADHIQSFVRSNDLKVLSAKTSLAALRHLERTFPLGKGSTAIVDWNVIPSTKLDWVSVSDDVAAQWSKTTIAGRCPYGLLVYNAKEPCLLGSFDFMIRNLDELVWKTSGCRILFGVHWKSQENVEFTEGVVEFDGKGTLFATIEE